MGTFSWYCPHDETEDDEFGKNNYCYSNKKEAQEKTAHAIGKMLIDFNDKLRIIKNLDQINKETERAVAFRISGDGDFHYIKRGDNGIWYHKRGYSYYIEKND